MDECIVCERLATEFTLVDLADDVEMHGICTTCYNNLERDLAIKNKALEIALRYIDIRDYQVMKNSIDMEFCINQAKKELL